MSIRLHSLRPEFKSFDGLTLAQVVDVLFGEQQYMKQIQLYTGLYNSDSLTDIILPCGAAVSPADLTKKEQLEDDIKIIMSGLCNPYFVSVLADQVEKLVALVHTYHFLSVEDMLSPDDLVRFVEHGESQCKELEQSMWPTWVAQTYASIGSVKVSVRGERVQWLSPTLGYPIWFKETVSDKEFGTKMYEALIKIHQLRIKGKISKYVWSVFSLDGIYKGLWEVFQIWYGFPNESIRKIAWCRNKAEEDGNEDLPDMALIYRYAATYDSSDYDRIDYPIPEEQDKTSEVRNFLALFKMLPREENTTQANKETLERILMSVYSSQEFYVFKNTSDSLLSLQRKFVRESECSLLELSLKGILSYGEYAGFVFPFTTYGTLITELELMLRNGDESNTVCIHNYVNFTTKRYTLTYLFKEDWVREMVAEWEELRKSNAKHSANGPLQHALLGTMGTYADVYRYLREKVDV